MKQPELKGNAAAFCLASPQHTYEDSYRLLPKEIPLVGAANRGELFAVFDGIGSAPEGGHSARTMAASLPQFFKESADITAADEILKKILQRTNLEINSWGMIAGTALPLGGCVGTVAWCYDDQLTIFHVGDTVGMLLRYDEEPQLLTELHETHGKINRYFGMGENLLIDVKRTSLEDGDVILLMRGVRRSVHPIDFRLQVVSKVPSGESNSARGRISKLSGVFWMVNN